ncbi:uncharacterized protein K441DRAFT_552403, partial [Cenococcum geophilum 1.58]|uniref:uncharacterized protein n=1 Tax=Cenococcum geophilum 1.58 TaxID=794803 RepID=UPI00358EB077
MSYIKRKLCQNLREEDRLILDWLTKTTYGPEQTDNFSRRQKGTGRWLLESDEFLKWIVETKQTLFCPGMPGAGKTVLTSTVVKDLSTMFRNDDSVGIAYLYCEFKRQNDQKPIDLLLSLLRQLIQKRPPVPENFKSLYEQHNKDDTKPSISEVSQILEFIVHTYSRTFIIIDALDECQVSEGGRSKFLSEIFNLQTKTGANVFATSRPIPDIVHEFEKQKSISLPVRASNEDIRTYLDPRMSELPLFVQDSPPLQEEIKTAILEAADGMFLLAKLHVDSLIGKRDSNALKETLKTLPRGLSDVYKQAIERIEGNVDDRDLAKQVLSWITCAQRPLTKPELRHALGVKIGASKLDDGDLSEIEDMVSVCAGLVTVDEGSNVIRLVHYTTQEYLERTLTSWCPNAHADITKICVTYLSFDAFTSGFCETDEKFETQLQSYVLYDYAAQNWGHHAREASTQATMELEHLILKFLRSEAKVSASDQAMVASGSYSGYSRNVPRKLTGVHLAAIFGLDDITIALLKHEYDPDPKDTSGRTPLSWAAGNGHEAVVKLLLEIEKVDADSKDSNGQTPLSWASGNGHEAVVKLLLETKKVDVDSNDSYGRTPL